MKGKIYIATESFASAHAYNAIIAGKTRVREGHALLQHHPMFFKVDKDQTGVADYEPEAKSR